MSKNEEKQNELQSEFDNIQNNSHFNPSNNLVKTEDMPDFGELEIYNYNNDLTEVGQEAIEIMDHLVDLYLGDAPKITQHPYILRKKMEDARVYARSLFLERMSEKLLIHQFKQVDQGDNSARMHEVINQTMREMREINTDGRKSRTEIESLYKQMRDDFGLNNLADSTQTNEVKPEPEAGSKVMDAKDLNDVIDKYIQQKK
jgi:hypothetical protein